MDLHTLIGLVGVAGYVVSYLMLQLGYLDGNGVRYSVANVLAAALVLVSLTDQFNLASALIQVIWIVIGLSGLALRLTRSRAAVSSPAQVAEVDTAPSTRTKPAVSPFRAAQSSTRSTYDLVPDAAGSTFGLRADVLDAFDKARRANSAS